MFSSLTSFFRRVLFVLPSIRSQAARSRSTARLPVKLAVERLEDRLTPSGGAASLPSPVQLAGPLAAGVNSSTPITGTAPISKTNSQTTPGLTGGSVPAQSSANSIRHEIEVGERHLHSLQFLEVNSVQELAFFNPFVLFRHHGGSGRMHLGNQTHSHHQLSPGSDPAAFSSFETENPSDQLFGNFSGQMQVNRILRSWTSQVESPIAGSTLAARKTLADKILAFGQERLGQGVDDAGSDPNAEPTSAAFVSSALRAAGARGTKGENNPGKSLPAREHRWGEEIISHSAKAPGVTNPDPDWSKVWPGDVIQFGNVILPNTSRTPLSQHTVIVEKNLGRGRFRVLHQNLDDLTRTGPEGQPLKRPYVTRDTLDLSRMTTTTDSTRGPMTSDAKVTVFRPNPAGSPPAQPLQSAGQ